METITYKQASKSLDRTMDKVCSDHSPVVIAREESDPVVLISLEDYHSLEETAFLLRSPKNAARLTQAIEEIESGNAEEQALFE